MVGKVFISCGQRPPREKNIASKVGRLLKEKFDLDCYLAFKIQGLNDIMKMTEELKASDYYLFIDFHRKDEKELPYSLFTHQELALAHHLGFKEIIAFQEKGAPLEGFLRYVQANPEIFESEEDLLRKVEEVVRERKWTKDYSRNLVLAKIQPTVSPLLYVDHTGQYTEYVWQARVENRRPDVAAVNTVCILDSIEHGDGKREECSDRSYLKWAGQMGYGRTILPKDYGVIDILAIHSNERGIYLHSALDVTPRQPILREDGKYKLNYKVFSESFPLLPFSIEVNYRHSLPNFIEWRNLTEASIAE